MDGLSLIFIKQIGSRPAPSHIENDYTFIDKEKYLFKQWKSVFYFL